MLTLQEKIQAAEQRRNAGLAEVGRLKRLIDTIESEVIAENILLDKYREQQRIEFEQRKQ